MYLQFSKAQNGSKARMGSSRTNRAIKWALSHLIPISGNWKVPMPLVMRFKNFFANSISIKNGDESAARHQCALCHRPRSSTYNARHPLVPGESPPPGICRGCRRTLRELALYNDHSVMEVQVHHYHHFDSCQGPWHPCESPLADVAELPGETIHEERLAPSVNREKKPRLEDGNMYPTPRYCSWVACGSCT